MIHPKVTVHPSAVVDEGAEVGAGTRIWHFSHVMRGARIGERCVIGQNVYIGARAVIGNGVKIQNNVSVYDDVVLEDDVFCGPSMVFTNVINPRAFIERKTEYRSTRVRRGATLGANSTIVCGNDIGQYAMIGAGAVITSTVAAHALMLGVPGRRCGWVCRCGVTLPTPAASAERTLCCPSCATCYEDTEEGLAMRTNS